MISIVSYLHPIYHNDTFIKIHSDIDVPSPTTLSLKLTFQLPTSNIPAIFVCIRGFYDAIVFWRSVAVSRLHVKG